jgi:uncharacterized protein YdiU (UPF0061 family)
MHTAEVDMTIFFRALLDIDTKEPTLAPFAGAFYDEAKRNESENDFNDWLASYATRLRDDKQPPQQRREKMAIDRAEQGDYAGIHELLDVMRRPYDDQPGREAFAARRPDWARTRAGCSMLSCSS